MNSEIHKKLDDLRSYLRSEVLGARATPGQFRLVKSVLSEAEYDEISRIIKVQKKQDEKN